MKQSEFLNKLMGPAFWVQAGQVLGANISALQRNIAINTPVADYILAGAEEYAAFTTGKLCLTLVISNTQYIACVTPWENGHLFCLETEYDAPELRAFALASQQLRGPLASAMAGTELLISDAAEDENTLQKLAQVNHSLHRLLRIVCNMSDAAIYKAQQAQNQETGDIVSILQEILEKTTTLAEKANRKLTYKLPNETAVSLADRQKLERAILNMISNALRFSPAESTISAQLKKHNQRLYFTVENPLAQQFVNEPFFRYLREPSLENSRAGIGLGLSIIQSIASAHGGTVLMELTPDNTVRFTLTMAIRSSKTSPLRSPVLLPVDYAGGKDRAVLELADVLPDSLFRNPD